MTHLGRRSRRGWRHGPATGEHVERAARRHRARSSGDRHRRPLQPRRRHHPRPRQRCRPEEPTPPSASWPEDEQLGAPRWIFGREGRCSTRLRARSGGRAGRHGAVVARGSSSHSSPDPAESDAYDVQCTVFAPPRLLRATRSSSRRSCTCSRTPTSRARSRPSSDVAARRRAFRSLECSVRLSSRIQFELRCPASRSTSRSQHSCGADGPNPSSSVSASPPGASAGTVSARSPPAATRPRAGPRQVQVAIETGVTQGSSEPQGEGRAATRLPSSPMVEGPRPGARSGAT